MKELLRFKHIAVHPPELPSLSDYNLSIFVGEIVVLHGAIGCGKESVIALLEGTTLPTSGSLYFCDKELRTPLDFDKMKSQIYVLGTEDRIVNSLSVIENLTALCNKANCFSFYSRNKAFKEIQHLLDMFNLSIQLDTKLENLTYWERQKLDFVKACIIGTKLIIINCAANEFNRTDMAELIELILTLQHQGISFLIVSEKKSQLTDIADRYQLLHHGMDLREWRKEDPLTEEQKNLLMNPQYLSSTPCLSCRTGQIICLYDDAWGNDMLWKSQKIIERICVDRPELAQQYFFCGRTLPPLAKNSIVKIPRNSHSCLMENLSIADNLTICIPHRICSFGIIRRHRVQLLFKEFCKMMNLSTENISIHKLDLAERKILSIHRWVLMHPQIIILEDPFAELDSQGTHKLVSYLLNISAKIPRIIVLERTLYGENLLYNVILKTCHGQNVEVVVD